MATERLPMRKLREILRLKWVAHRSHREVARSFGVSAGTVAGAVGRARASGLTWAAVEAVSDEALERLLFGPPLAEISTRIYVLAAAGRSFGASTLVADVRVSPRFVVVPVALSNRCQTTTYSSGACATSASTAAFRNVNVPEGDRRTSTTGFTAGR